VAKEPDIVHPARVEPPHTLVVGNLARWRSVLKSFIDKDIEVIVRKRKRKRSDPQNRYLHGVVFPLVAEAMGETDLVEVKRSVMGEKWGWAERRLPSGVIIQTPLKGHTSDLTVEETSEMIEWVGPWAFNFFNGLRIPLPNEVDY
jgi:hypothetical protein